MVADATPEGTTTPRKEDNIGRILSELLKLEHRQAGFALKDDEDFVYLTRGDKIVAVWNATKATAQAIRNEADRLLAEANNK